MRLASPAIGRIWLLDPGGGGRLAFLSIGSGTKRHLVGEEGAKGSGGEVDHERVHGGGGVRVPSIGGGGPNGTPVFASYRASKTGEGKGKEEAYFDVAVGRRAWSDGGNLK